MFNQKHLKELQQKGLIRGFRMPEKKKGYSEDRVALKRGILSKPKAILWLDWNLQYFCNTHALTLEMEYRFCPDRKYKSDYAIPSLKILIEYEGGIFLPRGGHNSPAGIQRDIEKYALAEKLGWKVVRLHALNYTTVLKTLNELIK